MGTSAHELLFGKMSGSLDMSDGEAWTPKLIQAEERWLGGPQGVFRRCDKGEVTLFGKPRGAIIFPRTCCFSVTPLLEQILCQTLSPLFLTRPRQELIAAY